MQRLWMHGGCREDQTLSYPKSQNLLGGSKGEVKRNLFYAIEVRRAPRVIAAPKGLVRI